MLLEINTCEWIEVPISVGLSRGSENRIGFGNGGSRSFIENKKRSQ